MVFRRIPKFADNYRRFPKKTEDVSNIYHTYLRVQSPESRVQSPESSPESSPAFRLCRGIGGRGQTASLNCRGAETKLNIARVTLALSCCKLLNNVYAENSLRVAKMFLKKPTPLFVSKYSTKPAVLMLLFQS